MYFNILNQIEELKLTIDDNINEFNGINEYSIQEVNNIKTRIKDYLNNKIINEIKSEKRKFEVIIDENKTSIYRVSTIKNEISFFAKEATGICTSKDVKTWVDFDNYFHINILDSSNKICANIQAYVEEVSSAKVLVLRGINPTKELLKNVSASDFVENIIKYGKELATKWGLEGVYITESLNEWHADSNRAEVVKYIRGSIYPNKPKVQHEMRIKHNMNVNYIYRL